MCKKILATTLRLLFICFVVSAVSLTSLARSSTVTAGMLRSISLTRPAAADGSNNVVLSIEVARRRGQSLPAFIIVNYNDKKLRLDRSRLTSTSATYTVAGQAQNGRRFEPIRVQVVNGQTPKRTAIGCSIGIVRCPRGCKSILFGTDCAVCIVATCDSSPDFPSVN